MRKKTLFIVLCLLSGILTLGGCGKSETDDAKTQKSEAKEEDEWEETPVAPIEKEDLKKIGVPLKGTVEIKLENNTGKSITGFAVKKSENSEFGENLLEDEDVYVKGEKRYFYYDYKQENSEEETETISADYDGNTEEETDESVPEYDIQITYLNGTTAVLHNFPFDDMKEGTLELEDEITYLTYTSIKTKKEVDTKDEERSIRTKEETAAAEAQRKANEAAAAEAKRQAAEAAAAKQQAEAAAAEAQKQAQAAADAQAQAQAEAQAKADAQAAQEAEIQRAYAEALTTYQNETLPQYQKELGELNAAYIKAQSEYNQADNNYQMAFAQWQVDQSDENAQALDEAESTRSQAEIDCQAAKEAYEDKKAAQPKMPEYSDYSSAGGEDFVTDGTQDDGQDLTDQGSVSAASTGSSVDTSGIENAIEQASSDLADLQSDLATQKSIAEADSTSLTKEEKEKLRVSNNLTELDAKSAKELVAEGKKGITADFNGVISKSAAQQGAAVTQGMELFTLQNTDKVSVDINVSKYDYAKVKEGQTADITIGDKKYTGKVTKISHIATTNEKGSTLIAATVSIDKPDKDIFLGVDAKVKIYAEKAENVVTLPAGVVNIGKDGSFCYVLKDGVITRQDITTGISSEDSVEITDGIKVGDEVIEDLGSLEEGMTAEAAPADGDSAAETGETANE